jgi:hypothetical protein
VPKLNTDQHCCRQSYQVGEILSRWTNTGNR